MLTLKHLSVSYGTTPVLRDIDVSFDTGLTVLLGQNGAGKTTLLRAVAGTVSFEGDILLGQERLAALPVKVRATRLSRVTSAHGTLSGITGQTLVEMALYPRHGGLSFPSAEERERIAALANDMGVARLLPALLEEMSAGERQLLRLLAAMVQDTPLCLFDEPTASLDYNHTHEFLTRAKAQGKNKILLMTLHDPALALRYADRILLLSEGRLAGDFLPADVSKDTAESLLQTLYPGLRVEVTSHGLTAF